MLPSKYVFALLLVVFSCNTSWAKTLNFAELSAGNKVNTTSDNADTSKPKKGDTALSSSPRDGKYLILSYGSNPANPMRLGYFTLTGNDYKYYDLDNKLLGEGTYVYDVTDKQVKWQVGPFKSIGWNGDFTVEKNGKTHTIRLKSNTVGTNTIE